ncbi:aryl-sulfate sulfotransferase [Rhodoferax koreense]|uniref:Aryl-sulfate sulfotransferase n=1 Tax=Rhodoferax koreensis TaxID=1842727 RepID=A0A1P8JSK8_9BURK|nr:ribbon-helix-helix domain-containing protein [Rhodoferax koreense]APW36737.1 aryl-sulfate sulfotransferase [Rhodoferax koreense]
MCEYFVKADPIQYEQRSRTVRIRNVLTSIRLENMVWDILAEMAEEEGCTTNALIAKFHDEILAHRGEVPNFASFLRVTSMRYLRRCLMNLEKQLPQPAGEVVRMGGVPGQVPKPLVAPLVAVRR